MNPVRLIAVLLIVGGALSLLYGGFSYTKATHTADLGPVHLEVKEKQDVNIPLWAGIAVLVGGVGLLLIGSRKG